MIESVFVKRIRTYFEYDIYRRDLDWRFCILFVWVSGIKIHSLFPRHSHKQYCHHVRERRHIVNETLLLTIYFFTSYNGIFTIEHPFNTLSL